MTVITDPVQHCDLSAPSSSSLPDGTFLEREEHAVCSHPSRGLPEKITWTRKSVERRQNVAKMIYALWTSKGSDLSLLVEPLLDGRIDALGMYCTFGDDDDDNIDDELNRSYAGIERVCCRDLSYKDFFSKFMLPNRPVIIQGLTETWGSKLRWTKMKNGREEPNLDYLCEQFGEDVAAVHVQHQRGFTTARPEKREQSVSEYASWWHQHEENGEVNAPLHYLKDWKFVAAHPTYNAYEWPEYFQDDWLNGMAMGNAYKFVYLGPAGTCTRLHADVLRSFSWSTNVCGQKRWYLTPPEYTFLLYDCFGASLASHVHADKQDGMASFFPGLAKARRYTIEVIQESGETIFVPSGWHHTVENTEPTLSINHNWLNATNVHWSWEKLRTEIDSLHSSENDGHSTARQNTDAGASDTSQVGGDLLLLWLVLSKKTSSLLADEERQDDMVAFNLRAILPILEGIQEVMRDGKDQGLTKRCECNIDELILDVKARLKRCYLPHPSTAHKPATNYSSLRFDESSFTVSKDSHLPICEKLAKTTRTLR
jgi:hypothetical protein